MGKQKEYKIEPLPPDSNRKRDILRADAETESTGDKGKYKIVRAGIVGGKGVKRGQWREAKRGDRMKRGDRGIFWIFKKGRRGFDKGEKWETKGDMLGVLRGRGRNVWFT